MLFLLLLLSADIALGSAAANTIADTPYNKHNSAKPGLKPHGERAKRAVHDDEEPFWPNRGKKLLASHSDHEPPFWANRGRRDSGENYPDAQKAYKPVVPKNYKVCEDCFPSGYSDEVFANIKQPRDDVVTPFWGHRGRRSSEELDDNDLPDDLFWGSRGRRQENEPFWGNRGRRQSDSPFWGTRGRREEEPFWGNRGRREEAPFWGHRGRREDANPFWGNRGRREESDPFWGNRGRRAEEYEPFWGNRGRRKEESEPFWSSRGRRKEDLRASIQEAINDVENNIENLSRIRRSNYNTNSFWANRSRESKLQHLFNGPPRTKSLQSVFLKPSYNAHNSEAGTVHDNKIYADEPHYILVDRSSRSSGEVDPFYISRGKKYYVELDLAKAARDRRGAIEEIVKSVRNDPYYIARGKKDSDNVNIGNATMPRDDLAKAKELICATVELIMIKNGQTKSKREIDESERDRRTILKKLAAQLQMDPYFVSRGKKNDDPANNDDYLQDFVSDVAGKCTS